jgi:hypothetical protein
METPEPRRHASPSRKALAALVGLACLLTFSAEVWRASEKSPQYYERYAQGRKIKSDRQSEMKWEWGHPDPGVTFVTLGLVLIAGVQAVLFLVQLRLMRESLTPAKEAAEAARDAAKHIPVVERAYVSGGGAFTAQQTIDKTGNRILITPVDPFQLTVDNHGKTPARVIHIEIGFCNASAIPPAPQYTVTRLFNGVIPPGKEGAGTGITFTRAQIAGDCIFGRFYYWDIFRERMRHSGFILHITPELGVEAIAAPAAYTDWN